MKKKTYRSFSEARKFAQSLDVYTISEWRAFAKTSKRPKDIPSDAVTFYKKEWKGWPDFLGSKPSQYRDFIKARKFVHKLNLKTRLEWNKFCKSDKKPDDIPRVPWRVYTNKGWTSMGDWLGTDYVAPQNRKFLSYDEAKKFAQTLGITTTSEWRAFAKSGKLPKDIPSNIYQVYKNKGWKGIGDFLGTQVIANQNRKYNSFEDARKFIHSLNLKSKEELFSYMKSNKPKEIPYHPERVYKKEWKGWPDWIGTDTIAPQIKSKLWLPWKEAMPIYRKLAKEYELKNGKDWIEFANSHKKQLIKLHLPQDPWRVYTKERVWRKIK